MTTTTVTTTMIRLSQLTAGKWLWDLLNEYEPLQISEGDRKGEMTGPPLHKLTQLEGPGDLEEVNAIINDHCKYMADDQNAYSFESPIAKLKHMWDFVNAAQNICDPSDLTDNIPACANFERKYPAIWDTLCVWAWG